MSVLLLEIFKERLLKNFEVGSSFLEKELLCEFLEVERKANYLQMIQKLHRIINLFFTH